MKSKILKAPLPYIALLIVNLIWGATPVIAKVTLQEIPFVTLAFLRFFIAFLLLLPFVLTSKQKFKLQTKDFPKFVALALLLVTFHIFFFFAGIQKTSAINASVLSLTVPIISVLAGWWFLHEKIYWVNLVGILVGLMGALVIIGIPLLFLGSLTSEVLIGNILIILSGLSFVAGAVLSSKMLKDYSPLAMVAIIFFIGSLTFLPLSILEFQKDPVWIYRVSVIGMMGVIYMVLLSSISAYFLYSWALERVGIIRADLVQYIQPAVAASLAIPILGERISFSFIIGTCLIVLGVYWGTLGRAHHHHHHLRHQRV